MLRRFTGKIPLVIYCLVSLAAIVVLGLISFSFLLFGLEGRNWLQESCANIGKEMKETSELEKSMIENLRKADENVFSLMNSNMCTSYCSCFQGDENLKTYNKYSELTLNEYGRTRYLYNQFKFKSLYFNSIPKISHSSMKHCYQFLQLNKDQP